MNRRQRARAPASPACRGDDHGPAGGLEVGFGVEANLSCAVVNLQIAQCLGIGAALVKVREQHAELGAPIAYVVLPNDPDGQAPREHVPPHRQ